MRVDDKTFAPMKIEGEAFAGEPFKRDGVFQLAFSFRDNFGLTNSPPLRLAIQSKSDELPAPQFVDIGRDLAVLHTDVLEIKTVAQDDFGVRSVGLAWGAPTSSEQVESFGVSEVRKELTTRDEKRVERTFSWSPVAFRVPPNSMVELSAWAKDFYPERERVHSQPVRIFVLGNEKHAEFVRQRLDSIFARLEEVSRLEEKIAANTEALLTSTNLQPEKLEGTANDQQRNAGQLEQLAKEGVRTMQDAMKNPLLPEQFFADWSKNLQAMERVARQSMKQAAQALQAAKQNSGQQNASQRQEQLAKAREKEEEALQELAKMQQQINNNLDDLQALTLSHRLRQVASTETQIETALQKNVSETIGLLPRELPEPLKNFNVSLAAVQTNVLVEAGNLHKEISRFYERTKKENYGDVSEEMAEQKPVEGLDQVRSLIMDNVAMEASRNSATWAVKFTEWAEKLEPKEYCEGGGNGQGEGKKQVDMTKVLVALLKLRQAEINVRGQTSLLEEQRANKTYKEAAKELLSAQKQLTANLHTLLVENLFEQLDAAFSETQKAMRETEALLSKPRTDAQTVAAENRAIENLTDLINLINEQAKRSNKSSPQSSESAEDMSMLMQMGKSDQLGQGMPSEKSGGGNTTGGTTDRVPGASSGESSGKAPGERKVARASGAVKNAPVEFREALENYFKAVEESE